MTGRILRDDRNKRETWGTLEFILVREERTGAMDSGCSRLGNWLEPFGVSQGFNLTISLWANRGGAIFKTLGAGSF